MYSLNKNLNIMQYFFTFFVVELQSRGYQTFSRLILLDATYPKKFMLN